MRGADVMKTGHKSPAISAGVLLSIAFIALIYLFPNGAAHEILNGIFVGVAVVVCLVFWRVTLDTVSGRGEYHRAQRMALGITLLWVAFNLRTFQSILYRATDNAQWVLDLPTSAAVTFIAIIAGYLQITSPGFRMQPGYVHGHSRARLAFAVILGTVVAGGVIWLQHASILSLALG